MGPCAFPGGVLHFSTRFQTMLCKVPTKFILKLLNFLEGPIENEMKMSAQVNKTFISFTSVLTVHGVQLIM